jgi:hypothetical protein
MVQAYWALDISLSDWCCSVSMMWGQIPSVGWWIIHYPVTANIYIIRRSKQVITTHYIYPTGSQSYLWYYVNTKYYIYVSKLYQTVLQLDIWAVKFCSSFEEICAHTFDTLQHQSLSLISSAIDHSTTSTP